MVVLVLELSVLVVLAALSHHLLLLWLFLLFRVVVEVVVSLVQEDVVEQVHQVSVAREAVVVIELVEVGFEILLLLFQIVVEHFSQNHRQ